MVKDIVLFRARFAPPPRAGSLLDLFLLWAERSRARRALSEMDQRRLSDIGITRREALREARKPFWRA
ncbi:MAG: DUF1127 domain-containing protein [Pseudomonadota bacterium]